MIDSFIQKLSSLQIYQLALRSIHIHKKSISIVKLLSETKKFLKTFFNDWLISWSKISKALC